jgi:hypothetical protein
MIVPRGIVGVMRMILGILAAARFDRDFDFVVTDRSTVNKTTRSASSAISLSS